MTIRTGIVYSAIAGSLESGNRKADFPVLVLEEVAKNNRPSNHSYFECFCFETCQTYSLRENQLKSQLNAEEIEIIKKFHLNNIERLENLEKCLNALEVSEVSIEDYIIWSAINVMEKDGATKAQKVKELVKAYKSI